MMQFTFKHLRYFVAAAETKSVTRAAERVNVSQPSVSAALTHLEAVFGVQLFIRHHAQGLSPTPAGQRLVGEVKQLLKQAETLHHYGTELADSLTGNVEVGCFLTLAPIIMPGLIRKFGESYPGIQIHCQEADHEVLLDSLRNGKIEVALTYDLQLEDGFHFEAVATLPPYAIVSPNHPLAARKSVALKELCGEPMVLLDLPHSRDYFRSIFLSQGIEPKIVHKSASPDTVRGMVANGFGFSLLNARLLNNRALDGKAFQVLTLQEDLPPLHMGVVSLSQSKLTRSCAAFVSYCRDTWQQAELSGSDNG